MAPVREVVEKYPFLCRHVGSGIYHLRTTIRGRTIERSTKTSDLRKAVVEAKRLMIEAGGDVAATTGAKVTFMDLKHELLRMQKPKAPATIALAQHCLGKLERFFQGWSAENLSELAWADYVDWCQLKDPGRGLEHDRRHFIQLCRLAYDKGILRRPVKVSKIGGDESPGRALDDAEVARLLAAARTAGGELHVQVLMALTMGMRKGEILRLTWERADLERCLIHLRAIDTKIRKARTFAISRPVLPLLRALQEGATAPFVFPHKFRADQAQGNLQTAWEGCRKRAGVQCRFHDLRHTFLTRAFKQSINPALICHFAGLSLEEAQKTYLHFTADDTRQVAEATWESLGRIL